MATIMIEWRLQFFFQSTKERFRVQSNTFRSFILGVCFFVSGIAHALPLTGSIGAENGGGMVATGSWNTIDPYAHLSWSVTELPTRPGYWLYEYVFEVPRKALSHLIIETSNTFASANIKNISEDWELGTWGTQGNSNPGIPSALYGIKWDDGDLLSAFFLVSDRAPMWGSFYAKDGRDGGADVYAYNTSFGTRSSASIFGPAPEGFILVPDTISMVPEPSSVSLFGLGFLTLAGMRLRRRPE